MPRLVCIQHMDIEGPGALADWAHARGYDLCNVPLFADAPLPRLLEDDLLVVLGGPMSVADDRRYPWLGREKRYVEEALATGRKVVGICLGAQILASVLGARVSRNDEKEIGWYEVRRRALPFSASGLPRAFTPYHWHSDRFDLPTGAARLWSSAACEQQGFLWRDQALGLQFHLETTPSQVDAMCTNFATDLGPSRFVQSRDEMLAEPARFAGAYRVLATLLDEFMLHQSAAPATTGSPQGETC